MAASVERKSSKDLVYFHCGKKGHTRDKCYRIIGFPKDFKFTKGKGKGSTDTRSSVAANQVNVGSKEEDSITLSQTHIKRLLQLLETSDQASYGEGTLQHFNEFPTQPLSNFASKHYHPLVYNTSTSQFSGFWILDSGV